MVGMPQSYGPIPAAAEPKSVAGGNLIVNFEVELEIPSTFQEQAFLNGVDTPGSPYYDHYLRPQAFVSAYGPSTSTIANILSYYRSFGLSVSPVDGLLLWNVKGTATQVDSALHTTLWEWQNGSATVLAPESAPEMPATLAPWIEYFIGLNGFAGARPLYIANHGPRATTISPADMRLAYNATSLISGGDTGSSYEIGLAEICDPLQASSTYQSDVNTFDSQNGLPAATIQLVGPGATNCTGTGYPGWGEETDLDIQWAHVIAPGAKLIVCLDTTIPVGCDANFTTSGIIFGSNSWGAPGSFDSVWAAAKAAGVTLFTASGDKGSELSLPAAEPTGIAVGGTVLTANSTGWVSEKGWADGGGGCDSSYAPPSYQIGMTGYPGACGSTSIRGVPDVAMNAGTLVNIINDGIAAQVNGTSLACPMWAATMDLIYEYSGFSGFGGARLYAMAKSANYNTYFHDITKGSNGNYSDTVGWDPVTGIGTPNIGALATNFGTNGPLTASLTPSSSKVDAGIGVNLTTLASGGKGPYAYAWQLNGTSISGSPNASAYTFVPAHPASYRITVVVTDRNSSTVTAGPAYVNATSDPAASISASPTTAVAGSTFSLTGSATGGSGVYNKYVWSENGSTFATTTTGSTTWKSPASPSTFTLGVRVYDTGGGNGYAATTVTTTSSNVLTVSLTVTPSTTVDVGVPVNLSATASGGTGPYNYLFFSNGTNILYNGTSSSYIWTPSTGGSYTISVTATDSTGKSATSTGSTVDVSPAPAILLNTPSPSQIKVGQSVNLSVVVTGGNSPYDYTFLSNGTSTIFNGTSPTYSWKPSGAATYILTAQVVDRFGLKATSTPQTVTVAASTTTSQLSVSIHAPSPAVVDVGQSFTLDAVASGGTAPYSYVWSLNGAVETGTQSANYTYTSSAQGQVTFHVEVSDSSGDNANSSSVTLTVNSLPSVTVSGNSTPFVGTSDVLTADASGGTPSYSFTWSIDGTAQGGATGQSFIFNESKAGTYSVSVKVTDSVGGHGSSPTYTMTVVNPGPSGSTSTTPPWYQDSPLPGVASATLGWLILIALIAAVVIAALLLRGKKPGSGKIVAQQTVGTCASCGASSLAPGEAVCPTCGTPTSGGFSPPSG